MRIGLLIASLLMVLTGQLHAQSCGRSDTLLIPTNTANLTFTIPIADYVNDDLSAPDQGLCGIELSFVHQFVENLELSLTSPGGQTVQLIGPNSDDQFDFTFFTQWQISFVPGGSMPFPDPGFAPQWDNEQPNSFFSGALYTGSYWPYSGNLEDFNTGPVNGDWTITVHNNPSNYPGALTYIRLYFCDARGVDCCFAAAGNISTPDFTSCVGDTSLAFVPEVEFAGNMPDTTEYGYLYLLGADSIYVAADSVIDLTGFAPGTYQICGLSYRRSELDSLPLPNGQLTIDSLQRNINGFEAWLCGDVTTDCLTVIIAAPPDTTVIDRLICTGDSTAIADEFFSAAGIHFVTLPASTGCDSVVQLNLDLYPIPLVELERTICQGDSVVIGGQAYFVTGSYQDTLTTTDLGCDSIVHLDLTVLAPVFTDLSPFICVGEAFTVGDSTLTEPGSYEIPLISAAGCDSIVRVDLSQLTPQSIIGDPDSIDCENNGIMLDGLASTPAGNLSFTWQDDGGLSLGSDPSYLATAAGDYFLIVTQTAGGHSCYDTSQVNVTDLRVPLNAVIAPSDTLTCAVTTIDLQSTGSSTGPGLRYDWSRLSGGAFVTDSTGTTVAVSAPGVYQLIVRDTVSSCRDTTTITVVEDIVPPVVSAGTGFTLTCALAADTLQGTASASNDPIAYSWSGPCLTPTTNPSAVIADCPGWYLLTATNTRNGCPATDSAVVIENRIFPEAVIVPPDTLNCLQTSQTLDGSGSNPLGLISYSWSGPGLAGPATDPQLDIDQAGQYALIVTRSDNQCTDTALILVPIDTLPPQLDLPADTVLNCYADSILIYNLAMVPPASTYDYQWLRDGIPVPDATSDSLLITVPALYTLSVTDPRNGCARTDSLTVAGDFALLPADAGPNVDMDCSNTVVTLAGDSTLYSEPVQASWSGPCILSDPDSWSIQVDCPGIYTLTVTRLSNGCSRTDQAEVILLDDSTDAVLGPDTTYIDCQTGQANLITEGTQGGIFHWFLDGESINLPLDNPVVTEPGLYTLVAESTNQMCTDTAQSLVILACDLQAVVLPPDTLTCVRQSVVLDGSASSGASQLAYEWLPPGPGCLAGPTDGPTAVAVCPGTFGLVVSQPATNQRDTVWAIVAIDTVPPPVEAGPDQLITCQQDEVTLTGGPTPLPSSTSFAWTTGLGDTISQSLNLTTSTAGTYFLTMEDGQNGCRSTDFAVVTLDNQVPMITFGSEVFPCEEPTFTLEAFVMPADPLYEFQWSGQGITGPADELQVVIDTSGWYTFTVHQPQTGCTRTDSVLVTAQTCIPCIELAPVDTLNCLNETVTLSAGFCLPCVGCTLSWADQNGPIPGANDLELTVDTPGTYTLTATDTLGFSSVLTVTVVARLTPPVIDIGPDRLLTCDSLSVTLGSEENILADSLSYQWLTLGGELLASDLSTLAVEIADTFILRVTNLINGCVAMDTAIVRYDTLAPVAEAGPTATLTCETSLVVLDGSASSQNNTSFQWTAPAPGCLQGAQNVNPLAACAGTYQLLVTNLANGCTAADSVEVLMQAELPPLMPLPDTLLTCDNPVIVLNTDVPATGNFTYRWCQLDLGGEEITTTCEFALTYTVSEPGDYRFFLRDEDSGCENSFDVAVGIDTLPPAVDAGTSAVLLCTLDSLQLQGSADALAQLQWQADPEQPLSAENIANPWVQAPGWYYLTATNPHTGCVATDSVFIAQDANLPELQTGQDTLLTCQQPTVTLSATATTTSGQASWSWSGPAGGILSGANSPAPLIQQAGTYWVTVTDPQNTCAVSDSVLVSADFRQPGIAIAGLDTMVLTCAVDTLLLDASLSQGETGAGLSYQWTAFGAGQLFPDLSAPAVRTDRPGNYRLIITDQGNGCRDTLAFTLTNDVALPTVVLPQPALLTCLRDTVILSASGSSVGPDFAYQWLAPDGLEGQGLTFDATLTGYHYLTILDESNGCSRRDSVRVQANRQRPAAQITPPATLTCTVSEVLLDGSGSATGLPYTFAWSTTNGQLLGPTDALTATAGAPGRYQLLVIDERNGCDSLVTVEVLQEGAPITAVDLVVESPPCVGDLFGSISVDEVSGGTPPFLYRLNGGTAGPNVFFEDLSVGTYLLDITDANGCAWQDTIKILPPEAFSVTIQGDTDITLGDSTILHVQGTQPVANLTWQPADLFPLPNEPMPTLVLQEDRFVWVSAINENGCIAGDTVRITVEKIRPLYVPTAFSPNGDGQNDRFTIYAGPEVVNIDQLRIFDRWGNMIFSREDFAPNDPNLGWDGFFEGRRVNSAVFVYLLEVTYVDGWQEMKTGEVMVVW